MPHGTDAHGQGRDESMTIRIVPTTLRAANAFVAEHHRHHKPARGCKFVLAVSDGEQIRGVAIVGRPVARHLDDGLTAEVVRCCTDGAPNACSMLYGAAWRAARAIGYRRLITYTLPEEGGASLRGAGWRVVGRTRDGDGWDRKGRPRADLHPLQAKFRWEASV